MASLDGVLTRKFLAQATGLNAIADSPVPIRIRNKAGLAVTSVDVDNSSELITLTDSSAAVTTSMNGKTVGEVADAINAMTNWECVVLDALRSDSIDDKLVDETISTATTVDGISYYDLHADTSVTQHITLRLSFDRHTPKSAFDNFDRRVRINEISYFATLGGAGTSGGSGLKVYEVDGSVETLLMLKASISATETINYILNGNSFMDSGLGKDLVVRLADSTSLADAALHLQVNFIKE